MWFQYTHLPPNGGHVFQVLTRKTDPPPQGGNAFQRNVLTRQTAPPPSPFAVMCFNRPQPFSNSGTISQEKNVPNKFHEDWIKHEYYSHSRETALPPSSHVFQQSGTVFERSKDICKTNVLPKKTAPLHGGHVFPRTRTHFEIIHRAGLGGQLLPFTAHIFGTNVLTKFHEELAINVASKGINKVNNDDGRQTNGDHKTFGNYQFYNILVPLAENWCDSSFFLA
ncbi:hypothetical protein DPMN_045309 [Dreissena polymorpha]|uniref:Uncharacterized protein n=1 Tax=Dreissena polymorpha TaxID=45954 RepID=A0A9D4HX93_DREPO|nr:hypothetical protein DPMN_045309 [Dreissena polymorpha]